MTVKSERGFSDLCGFSRAPSHGARHRRGVLDKGCEQVSGSVRLCKIDPIVASKALQHVSECLFLVFPGIATLHDPNGWPWLGPTAVAHLTDLSSESQQLKHARSLRQQLHIVGAAPLNYAANE